MYTEPIPNVQKKEVPATNEAPQFLKTDGTPAAADSSAASGTDRNVSASVAEVPTPADPSADPYKRVCEFFSTTDANEEQWKKDLRDNMMELFVDAFRDDDAKRIGESVPQSEYKPLGIGYGPLGGQQFPEACAFELMLGPQGEPVYEPREPQTVRAEKAPVTLSRTYQRKELKIRTGPMCYRSADGEVIWC